MFPDPSSAAAREDIRFDHNTDLKHFTEFNLTDAAIKAQIIAAVEPQYIAALRLPTTNFITCTSIDFLTYLFATYAVIGPRELVQNSLNMQEQYTGHEPIATLWTQIEKAVAVADYGGIDINEAQQINSAIANLTENGNYRQEITEWNRRPANQKTWALLKIYFTQVEKEQKRVNPVGAGAGGYAAHVQAIAEEREANMALAAESYRQNQAMQIAMTTLATQLAALQQSVAEQNLRPRPARQPARGGRGAGRPAGRGAGGRGAGGRGAGGGDYAPHSRHFCWTHGHDCDHPSHMCEDQAAVHQLRATRANPMGSAHA